VRSERSRLATGVLGVTAVLVVVLAVGPASVQQILAGYVLALAGLALAALTRVARDRSDEPVQSQFDAALRPRPVESVRPRALIRTEREITLGMSNAGNLHDRLLPVLREAAAARLAAGHNVDLARRPDAARRLLGEETWQLLRPDRPEPRDREGSGISVRQLRALIDRLETL
jgi:hypothetical protein